MKVPDYKLSIPGQIKARQGGCLIQKIPQHIQAATYKYPSCGGIFINNQIRYVHERPSDQQEEVGGIGDYGTFWELFSIDPKETTKEVN